MPSLIEKVKAEGLPEHVALIMDGNGRWAKQRGLMRTAGHEAGATAAERIIRFAGGELGLACLTLFAFSTENWERPREEVDFLMDLLDSFIADKLEEFVAEGVRLVLSGDLSMLPTRLRDTVSDAAEKTSGGDGLLLNVALNYGSRQEIVRACRKIAREVAAGSIGAEDIDEARLAGYLYTKGIPDPDIVIRTSGEMRLSNFLLWQLAYAELYFTDTLWPDFSPDELLEAIVAYQRRDRRFGSVKRA